MNTISGYSIIAAIFGTYKFLNTNKKKKNFKFAQEGEKQLEWYIFKNENKNKKKIKLSG